MLDLSRRPVPGGLGVRELLGLRHGVLLGVRSDRVPDNVGPDQCSECTTRPDANVQTHADANAADLKTNAPADPETDPATDPTPDPKSDYATSADAHLSTRTPADE